MSRVRLSLEAHSRPADVHERGEAWKPKVHAWRPPPPAVDVPVVQLGFHYQCTARVLLTHPVDVSDRGRVERRQPGDELAVEPWHANDLIRSGFAVPAA